MRRSYLDNRFFSIFIAGIVPLYFVLSFSTVFCSFHHPVELASKEGQHDASGDLHHHHPSLPSTDFCKYAHSFSPVIYTPSTQVFVIFSPIEKTSPYFFSVPVEENQGESFLRGPPFIVNL